MPISKRTTFLEMRENGKKNHTEGKPIDGVKIKILNNQNKPAAMNEIGIIKIEDPKIHVGDEIISQSIKKFKINKNEINILLGIGGSGPTKRVPSKIFINFMDRILKIKKCRFYLATGKNSGEQIILKEILES